MAGLDDQLREEVALDLGIETDERHLDLARLPHLARPDRGGAREGEGIGGAEGLPARRTTPALS